VSLRLEVHDAALLLEAARTYQAKRADLAIPFAYPLLATFLLTGGRKAEVLGLEVEDVSLDRNTVTFRPNTWRRLKTKKSHRVVPLWAQLREILERYLAECPPSRLLFPSYRTGGEALYDPRKLLDAVAERGGWKAGEITPKMFRHSYTAARLQTLDQGRPGQRVHGRQRAGAWQRSDGGARLFAPGRRAAPCGRGRVPRRAARR